MAGENPAESETFTADPATEILTVGGVYTTGTKVRVSGTGTLPGGLAADTDYYVIAVPGGIQLAASLADARSGGPAINITDPGTGTLTISSMTLNSVNDGIDHINNMLSTIGAREETLGLHEDILSQHQVNITDALEQTESIDIAQAVMELSQQQAAYEAALRASSMFLNQPTLIQYV